METCLVTGGGGFIGSHVVEALLERGFAVRVLDNLSTGHRENLAAVQGRIEFIEGDIREPETAARAVDGVSLVFHLAAVVSVPWSMAHPLETEQVNTAGTLCLLEAAQKAGVRRLVFSSTCAVYGDDPTLPKTEAMPPAPVSPYAVSKLAAEGYCRIFAAALGLETVVLRYFNVFGPRQDPSSPYSGVISIFVDRLRRGQPVTIYGDGEQTRDFVYVGDVAQANLRAALAPDVSGQIFNIGTGRAVTVNHLFAVLSGLLNYPHPPRYEPPRAGDIRHSYADPSLARSRLGWSAQVAFEEGLRRLVG
ncbi:MAG: SDR family oxidoreductase, partial [Chloroflexi bacterium]